MTGLRVALATRRFWPQADWPETNMARLAVGLQRHGARVTIVSAHWDAHWPQESAYQGIPLIRLTSPNSGIWGTVRYALTLSRWLRNHRADFDVVCASRLRIDAYAALGAMKHLSIPVVLRADRAGPLGDCQWQRQVRFGARIRRRCRSAAAVVAPDEIVAEELRGAGYAANRIHVIPNGIPAAPTGSGGARFDARLALAESNADLTVANDAAVAVFIGRLRPENGLLSLLRAWKLVCKHRPDAKLWLFGDGPMRDELYQWIRDLDLPSQVSLPGNIDDLAGVLLAANLVVHPGVQPDEPQAVLEAIAAGVPVVVAKSTGDPHAAIYLGQHARIVQPEANDLANAILELIERPPSRATLTTVRRHVLVEHGLADMARRHLGLFARLCG